MSDVSQADGSTDGGQPAPAADAPIADGGAGSAPSGQPQGTDLGGGEPNGSGVPKYTPVDRAGFDWAANSHPDNLGTIENKGWKNVDDLIQSYSELEAHLGERTGVAPDPETATQEDWDNYYSANGRPDEPSEYGFTMPENVPETFQYDAEFADHYRQMAHRAGLSPRQANQLHGEWVEMMAEQASSNYQSLDHQVGEAHNQLMSVWGDEGTEGYNRNVELASRAMQQLGLEQSFRNRGIIAEGGAVLDADIAIALAKIGQNNYAEDNMYGGVGSVVTNPFADKTENMTIASQMIQNDPSRARNLIAAAGRKPEEYGL